MTKIPKARSELEEMFALQLRADKLDHIFEREYEFLDGRRWRFDFCDFLNKVAIEIEGGIWLKKGAHNTGSGIKRDIEKYNEATRMGWRVFRFDGDMVRSGEAINYTKKIYGGQTD